MSAPEPLALVGYYCDHSDEPLGERTHHSWEIVDGEWTFVHCPDTISSHAGIRDYLKPEQREQLCPRAVPVYPGPVIERLAEQSEHRRVRMAAAEADLLNVRGILAPSGRPRRVPVELGETISPAVEWLVNRVAELEGQLHEAAMTKVWTNEDGKKFVFVKDLAPALLGLPKAGA